MQIIHGLHNLRPAHRGCVATIGNFDGVHRGHQAVIKNLLLQARSSKLPATVIVFEPQPAEYFAGPAAPARLTTLRDKCLLLAHYEVERLVMLRFDAALASLTAAQFIQGVLIDALGIKGLIVGDDFKFGCDRGGDFSLLQAFAGECDFQLAHTNSFMAHDTRASSTRVRAALDVGDFATVAELLGHPYQISGRVVHGNENGRKMGFPTANLNLSRRRSPLHGIYAAKVAGLGATAREAIAYVGTRPILGGEKFVLEVHIFDYDEACYGQHIAVEFLHKIRDDLPFTSFAALAHQIALDCACARELLRGDRA